MSRARVLLAIVLASLIVVSTTAVVIAVTTLNGPFTGCLATKSQKTANTVKGVIYNVAVGSAPTAPCVTGDPTIAFANGGSGGGGSTACETPVGPGVLQVQILTTVEQSTGANAGFNTSTTCAPTGARFLSLQVSNFGGATGTHVDISPAPLLGPATCTELAPCADWIGRDTVVTLTATGTLLGSYNWGDTGCSSSASTCTFTMDHDRSMVISFGP